MKSVLLVTTRGYAWTSLEGTLLRHLPGAGVRPIVVSARAGGVLGEADGSGIEVTIVPGVADLRRLPGLLRLPRAVAAVVGLARRHRVGLLHSLRGSCALPVLLASRLTGIPHLCHLQFLYQDRRKYRKLGLHRARNVAAPAAAVLDAYRAAGGGAERARGFVVPYGIDADEFVARTAGRDVRAELGIPRDAMLVLMVGSLDHRKDPETLLRALARLRARGPEVHAVFVGRFRDRAYAERMQALAASVAPPRARVHFAGFQPEPSAWFRAADLFVLPTRGDAFPVVLLEAMAHGKPIVASRVGGVSEGVADGVSGFLAAPGDAEAFAEAVERLVGDRDLRQAMGCRGGDRVREEFSIAAEMRAVADAYGACSGCAA